MSSNELYFCNIARSNELAARLVRELLLGRRANRLPKKIRFVVPHRQLTRHVFLYPFLTDGTLADVFDRAKGNIPAKTEAILAKRMVDLCYAQRAIPYRPVGPKKPVSYERALIRSAATRPIYRRSELLRLHAALRSHRLPYYFEIGDLQLQNAFWCGATSELHLFDLEWWGEFRAHASLASVFTISWFPHRGERFSRALFKIFREDRRTTRIELRSFLLCCVNFIFIYYASYSHRNRQYLADFRRMVDWTLETAETDDIR